MAEYDSIEQVAEEIKNGFNSSPKKKIIALYAFNATGKTRLANILDEQEAETEVSGIKSLCYNVFLEDMFNWDNKEYILSFDPNSWIVELVNEQGLEDEITHTFKGVSGSHIEPSFDFVNGKVTFGIPTGDDKSITNIKISRGEESMLIWSFFYTILETAKEALNTVKDARSTQIFDDLEYIIIDDPVSSIDDTKIITVAINLIGLIESFKNTTVRFFILTHHALFYNVLVNGLNRGNNFKAYSLLKDNYKLELSKQNDSPFSYHLYTKEIIQGAIKNKRIERYHFNLFRALLEKTANFLGHRQWKDCLPPESEKAFIKIINQYSHSRLSDLEPRDLPDNEKEEFEKAFDYFIKEHKWGSMNID